MPALLLFGANTMSLQTALFARAQGFDSVLFSTPGQAASLQEVIRQSGLELVTAENPADLPIEKWQANNAPVLAISIGAPWFFDRDFLERRMNGQLLNLHGTHLPRGRGGTLFSWQIMSGQRTGMCLLHQMSPELDAGPIVDYHEFIYPAHCRIPADYIQHYAEKNAAFLEQFILQWRENKAVKPLAAQPEYLSTYWPRLRAALHGWLDWQWPALELERFICAFDTPYNGARCRWREKEVVIRDAWAQSVDGHTHPFQWGIVTRNNGQWLNVAAQGGELLIRSVLDVDGQNLIGQIRAGDRLYSPASDLEAAWQRIEKTTQGLNPQPPKP